MITKSSFYISIPSTSGYYFSLEKYDLYYLRLLFILQKHFSIVITIQQSVLDPDGSNLNFSSHYVHVTFDKVLNLSMKIWSLPEWNYQVNRCSKILDSIRVFPMCVLNYYPSSISCIHVIKYLVFMYHLFPQRIFCFPLYLSAYENYINILATSLLSRYPLMFI